MQSRKWALPMILSSALFGACGKSKVEKRPSADAGTNPSAGTVERAQVPPSLGDTDITRAVEASLRRDAGVVSADVHVKTTDGIVELTGSTGALLTKRRAVRVAEAIKGVRAVSERLELKVKRRPDAELTKHIEDTLLLDTAIQSTSVEVEVDDGAVTLTGSVPSYQQRDLCQWRAEGVAGVREVDNQLQIEPRARSDAEISSDVESRLRWDALINDGLIEVTVRDAVVILTGQVASAAERRRAAADAWVLGAKRVDDSGLVVQWWAKAHDLTKEERFAKSDAAIAEAIRAAAAYDPRVSAADLQVSVEGGSATLRGSVGTFTGKFAAEDLARNTVGVTNVENQLAVKPTTPAADATLLRAVRSGLRWNPYTDAFTIDVAVNNGLVTLTGEVDTAFARATATTVTGSIAGVRDVDNALRITRQDPPYVYVPYYYSYGPYWGISSDAPTHATHSDAHIANAIRDELKWSPFVDADEVEVTVERGKAVLSGEVRTVSERKAATQNAYEGGAGEVDNRLRIAGKD